MAFNRIWANGIGVLSKVRELNYCYSGHFNRGLAKRLLKRVMIEFACVCSLMERYLFASTLFVIAQKTPSNEIT
mgnify:FL=1